MLVARARLARCTVLFAVIACGAACLYADDKPLAFPPLGSAHRIDGALFGVDFVHRTGQFRTSDTGELVDFTLPPYGAIRYLDAEADLRDVPLGTRFRFLMIQDDDGRFTRLVAMQDDFSADAAAAVTYRLDEAKLDAGTLIATKHNVEQKQDDLGKIELRVTPQTRVWKAEKPAELKDLTPGDELLYNVAAGTAEHPGVCTDIWVGVDTHKAATEAQKKRFIDGRAKPKTDKP
ncbi:MAG: hypothetical protein GC159_17805 [Phycisphaera sp.]|nr:hypothetical protein [Phycisphaera sp.]